MLCSMLESSMQSIVTEYAPSLFENPSITSAYEPRARDASSTVCGNG